jgi:hypothetical protein
MSPAGPEEAAYLAQAAAGRGFDRFWIDVPAGDVGGEFSRLASGACAAPVSDLRGGPSTARRRAGGRCTEPRLRRRRTEGWRRAMRGSSGAADVNLFGEPFTALVRRRKNEPVVVEPNSFGADFWGAQVLRRQERSATLGDYLRPDRRRTSRRSRPGFGRWRASRGLPASLPVTSCRRDTSGPGTATTTSSR